MTKHKCNWQLSEDGAAICLECTTIIGADGLIESLQTENTKLQEESDDAYDEVLEALDAADYKRPDEDGYLGGVK